MRKATLTRAFWLGTAARKPLLAVNTTQNEGVTVFCFKRAEYKNYDPQRELCWVPPMEGKWFSCGTTYWF